MKTPSLVDILTEPTEQKPDISVKSETPLFDFEEKKEIPQPNLDHFEPKQEEKSAPDPIQPPEIQKPVDFAECQDTADMIVGTFDFIQTMALPPLYRRTIFTKEERKQLKNLKVKIRQEGIASLSEDEQVIFDKYASYEDMRGMLPFTDDEQEALRKPLAKLLKKYNKSIGPEWGLIGATITVMAPRLGVLFSPMERL